MTEKPSDSMIENSTHRSSEVRPSIFNLLKSEDQASINTKNPKFHRIWNAFKWRQSQMHDGVYHLHLEDKRELLFHQINNGEMKGLGTGTLVWPAAHVLSKYLEKRFTNGGLFGKTVCDIGSGTGCTGLVAAALGAKLVTLTDQECVMFLLDKNIDTNRHIFSDNNIESLIYDWGVENNNITGKQFDYILVSDCVLPKLYPIDILVKAVDKVLGIHSIALFSYEHRPFPEYDPRQEFNRLSFQHNMIVNVIPLTEHHDLFSADDIEIWEVRRLGSTLLEPLQHGNLIRNQLLTVDVWGDSHPFVPIHIGDLSLSIQQDITGGIGCSLWPSSIILSRYLLKYSLQEMRAMFAHDMPVSDIEPYTAIELGAGCGLASIVLSSLNYHVISTDKENVMSILKSNIDRYMLSRSGIDHDTSLNPIITAEFDWFKMNEENSDFTNSNNRSQLMNKYIPNLDEKYPDLIICSDCLYNSSSIFPLIDVLDLITGPNTIIVICNEMRTSFEEFTYLIRRKDNFRAIIADITITEPELEIIRSPSQLVISQPVRMCLIKRSINYESTV
eukprot:gene5780-7978_t